VLAAMVVTMGSEGKGVGSGSLPLASNQPHHHQPHLPRRRRSLTGPEMYHQWHECYDSGWHVRLMRLEEAGEAAIISTLAREPHLLEFAAFHNSQLVLPLPGVAHALTTLIRGQ